MTEARDGDAATYQTCTDPDCPAARPNTAHAHPIGVTRADIIEADATAEAEDHRRWGWLIDMGAPPPTSSPEHGPPADYDG